MPCYSINTIRCIFIMIVNDHYHFVSIVIVCMCVCAYYTVIFWTERSTEQTDRYPNGNVKGHLHMYYMRKYMRRRKRKKDILLLLLLLLLPYTHLFHIHQTLTQNFLVKGLREFTYCCVLLKWTDTKIKLDFFLEFSFSICLNMNNNNNKKT